VSQITLDDRHETERAHGRFLKAEPEKYWGQESKSGKLRIKRRAKMLIEACGLRSGLKVLELGCGSGNYTELYAASGADMTAVDLSEELLDLAKKRSPKVNFLLTPAETLEGIPDDSMDCVIGNAVLHHFDVPAALRAMHRVLKPGGVICFTEPNMVNPQIFLQKNLPWLKRLLGDSPHETAFFRRTIVKLLGDSGFTEASALPFDFLHPLIPGFMAGPVEKMSLVLEKIPGIKEIGGSLLIKGRKPEGFRG